jgi:hypothetical protein
VVDRSVTPGRTISVHDTFEEAQDARDRVAVVPDAWLQDELLHAFAVVFSEQRDVPYPSAITVLETLGEDQVWALVSVCVDRIGEEAGLIE